ncbi:calcium-binding protein [Sulfitobacter sp. 20_GPM-1509m]|uniref:calcium-binding protein n=1 Tax=Sulfitobacter sp. 20_GPM-1509m TaxID=1380367 RepID=UPI00068693EE|nr:calcium-binding protein [Sulfitobacter sp. 20_GPM-1509m]|tara:strand:- start:653 stop:1876 length:1224 start_codon:yes stop_codon:yes gene_type:complete
MPVSYTAINLTTLQQLTLDDVELTFFNQAAYSFPPNSSVLAGAPETIFQTENIFTITMNLGTVNGVPQSVTAFFTGNWPAPLSPAEMSNINTLNGWLQAAGDIQIDQLTLIDTRGGGFKIDIDFDGEGPTPRELVTSWAEEDLVNVLPPEPLDWTGTDGADIFSGTALDDVLHGQDGNDRLRGLDGDDTMFGDDGNDLLIGGRGNDELHGGLGGDKINGDAGNDLLVGGAGRDVLRGGLGDDTLYASDKNGDSDALDDVNHLKGGKGNDFLYGGDFNDTLDGGKNSDIVYGGAGDDVLIAGRGNDVLHGQNGADTFVFQSGKISGTKLVDITRFGGDHLLLEGFDGLDASVMDLDLGDRFQAIRDAGISATNVGSVWTVDFNGEAEMIINGGSFATEEQFFIMMDFI